jgi:hypothetical protein
VGGNHVECPSTPLRAVASGLQRAMPAPHRRPRTPTAAPHWPAPLWHRRRSSRPTDDCAASLWPLLRCTNRTAIAVHCVVVQRGSEGGRCRIIATGQGRPALLRERRQRAQRLRTARGPMTHGRVVPRCAGAVAGGGHALTASAQPACEGLTPCCRLLPQTPQGTRGALRGP